MNDDPVIYDFMPKSPDAQRVQDEDWYSDYQSYCEWAAYADWRGYEDATPEFIAELYREIYLSKWGEPCTLDNDMLLNFARSTIVAIPGLNKILKEYGF